MGANVAGSAVVIGASLLGCTTAPSLSTSPDAQLADASPPVTTAAKAVTAPGTAEAEPPTATAQPLKPGLIDAHGSAPVDKIIAAFGVRAKASPRALVMFPTRRCCSSFAPRSIRKAAPPGSSPTSASRCPPPRRAASSRRCEAGRFLWRPRRA